MSTPVARCCVLAYSCAAARDLHPLPNPPQARRTREPIFKSIVNVTAGGGRVKRRLRREEGLQKAATDLRGSTRINLCLKSSLSLPKACLPPPLREKKELSVLIRVNPRPLLNSNFWRKLRT